MRNHREAPPSIPGKAGGGGEHSRELQSAPKKPGLQRQSPGLTHTSSGPQASSPSHSAVGAHQGVPTPPVWHHAWSPAPPAPPVGWHPPPHHRHPTRWASRGSPQGCGADGVEETPSRAWGRGFWVSSIQGLPAVHSRPSCFQPGQHARPAGGLWDREGTSDGDRGWVRLCSASGLFG